MSELIWFIRTSWAYQGCDRGSGRWKARRIFALKIIPSYRSFRRLSAND